MVEVSEIDRRIRSLEGEVQALRNRVTILEKKADGNYINDAKN